MVESRNESGISGPALRAMNGKAKYYVGRRCDVRDALEHQFGETERIASKLRTGIGIDGLRGHLGDLLSVSDYEVKHALPQSNLALQAADARGTTTYRSKLHKERRRSSAKF